MNQIKFNSTALSLVTLFLSGVFSSAVFCQQSNNQFHQAAIVKSNRAISDDFNSTNKNRFFPEKKSSPQAEDFPAAPQTNYSRPNADERFKKYIKRTFSPIALLGDVVSAGFAQAIDSPEEWENNGKGFARRLGSAFGKSAIEETVVYGLDETLKLDSNFYKSGKRKFSDRLANAVLTTFAARKPDGKRVVGFPRIVGAYTSNIIATETWYPKNYDYKDGLRYGTISLGYDVLVNILKEFFYR
ncbi:MAG: hypothetical protein ACR2HG_04490 [Pyrinomonadaceae bacterium]